MTGKEQWFTKNCDSDLHSVIKIHFKELSIKFASKWKLSDTDIVLVYLLWVERHSCLSCSKFLTVSLGFILLKLSDMIWYIISAWVSPIIRLCIEYSCHIISDSPAIYIVIVVKSLRRICSVIDPGLVSRIQSLLHNCNVAPLCLFCKVTKMIRSWQSEKIK